MKHNLKTQSEHTCNDKVIFFTKNIVVIEEEWLDDINLTGGAIFPKALIKSSKSRVNQK